MEKMEELWQLAEVVRSKNAGPFRVTLDIFFKSREAYNRAIGSGALNREIVAQAYGIDANEIVNYLESEALCAVKITLRRRASSGSFEDSDVYGAQQHAPLLGIKVPPA